MGKKKMFSLLSSSAASLNLPPHWQLPAEGSNLYESAAMAPKKKEKKPSLRTRSLAPTSTTTPPTCALCEGMVYCFGWGCVPSPLPRLFAGRGEGGLRVGASCHV